jgi:RNA polymerase sigma-70 factor, ECF subfamily
MLRTVRMQESRWYLTAAQAAHPGGFVPMHTLETSLLPPPTDDTLRLTRRLAAGDEAAFREFHDRYFDALYQFLLVVSRGQVTEAQEVLQETLLRVARYARPFPDEEIFWRWLKMVARSAARDAARKQYRYLNLLRNYALRWVSVHRSGESAAEVELSGLLEESLLALDAEDRQLVEGKYLRGSSVRELAAQSGLTEKAVESRLLRLRRQLREQLLRNLYQS